MSYEEAIKAKHEFEDSLKEVLYICSVLTKRELELAVGRIGDGIEQKDPNIHKESTVLTAKIIGIILSLRAQGRSKESKMLRLWLRRKKHDYALQVAAGRAFKEHQDYAQEKKAIMEQWSEEKEEYSRQIALWREKMNALSFWERTFSSPPRPLFPRRPVFSPPVSRTIKAKRISQTHKFEEILIETLYYFKYPNVEYAESFVTEENIRESTQLLLETKGGV